MCIRDSFEAAHLENEFREILGIGEEDTLEDGLETLTPPLAPTKAYLSFMLPKRIANWLRVLSRVPAPAAPTAFVAVNREVVDEIRDRVDAQAGKGGLPPRWSKIPPVPAPCIPNGHPPEETAAKVGAVLRSDAHRLCEKCLEALLDAPESLENRSAFREAAERLVQTTEEVFGPCGPRSPAGRIALTFFTDLSLGDLKLAMDPGGFPLPADWAGRPAPPILCLDDPVASSPNDED